MALLPNLSNLSTEAPVRVPDVAQLSLIEHEPTGAPEGMERSRVRFSPYFRPNADPKQNERLVQQPQSVMRPGAAEPATPPAPDCVVPTKMIARLLKYDGSVDSSWSRGDFRPSPDFLTDVRFLREHTKYPRDYSVIQNLPEFKEWDKTKLVETVQLCEEMSHAAVELQNDIDLNFPPPGGLGSRGHYVRRDWSCNRVVVIGDIHGSLHSLLDIILNMNESGLFTASGSLMENVRVVFLGDLLDRSPYTLECLYIILRLCRENPEKVVLLAGNHETDEDQWRMAYGTLHEIRGEHDDKCTDLVTMLKKMEAVTRRLPSSLIADTSVGRVQFNHGSFESFGPGSVDAAAFHAFATFLPGLDMMPTIGPRGYNPLQWGDVGIHTLSPRELEAAKRMGRPFKDSADVEAYLTQFKLRLLVRGHSDFANLSLQYKKGTQPSEALQNERRVRLVAGEANYNLVEMQGMSYRDPREPKDKQAELDAKGDIVADAQGNPVLVGNVFVQNGLDFARTKLYDLFTLHEAPHSSSFDKTLIERPDENLNMLSVTVASCPFSKVIAPVQMMGAYLLIGV